MTSSPQVLALMALMREIEKPAAIYQRAVRRAAQTLTDSPENEAAQARGNAALLVIEQAVRDWVAEHPAEERTLTADNFDEVAEWCGGRPAVSDHRVLLIGGTDDTGDARYGDTIRRDSDGDFTIARSASA